MISRLLEVLACGAVIAAAAAWTPPPIQAVPVYTVLMDQQEAGAANFMEDLSRLWKNLHAPVPGRLSPTHSSSAGRSLRLLGRGRGHFAIIDTAVATSSLAQHEGLAAVALLWPVYLHALTSSGLASLARPIRQPVIVAGSARYVYDAFMEWNTNKRNKPTQVTLLADGGDFLETAMEQDSILLFSAPAPLARLVELMEEEPELRLASLSPRLVENLRLLNPWLQTKVLAAGTYPRMRRKKLLPVRYLLMVARKDLPEAVIRKMLITLYYRTKAMAPYSPLFGMMNPKLNEVFAQLIPYHPVTGKTLGFVQKSP